LSWQNLLNSPDEVPPVVLLLPPVLPVVPLPVPVPPDEVPPVPAPVPDWPVPVPAPVPVPVPADDDEELDDDWSCDWVWSVEVVEVWSEELELDEVARAAVPCGSERLGTDFGATSWLEPLPPQALTPRAAAARRTSTYVRMRFRVVAG
jgi:hypothetical protein